MNSNSHDEDSPGVVPVGEINTRDDAEVLADTLMSRITSNVDLSDDRYMTILRSLYSLLVDLLEHNARPGDDGAHIMLDAMRFNGITVAPHEQHGGYPGRKYTIPPGRYDVEATLIGGCFYCSGCGGMVWDKELNAGKTHPDIGDMTIDLESINLCVCMGRQARW